jgi:hypothetical protein
MQGLQLLEERDHLGTGNLVRLAVHHRAVGPAQCVIDVDVHPATVALQFPRLALADSSHGLDAPFKTGGSHQRSTAGFTWRRVTARGLLAGLANQPRQCWDESDDSPVRPFLEELSGGRSQLPRSTMSLRAGVPHSEQPPRSRAVRPRAHSARLPVPYSQWRGRCRKCECERDILATELRRRPMLQPLGPKA